MGDGIALLRQAIHDLVREGLASSAARDAAAWESLARRMVDAQAPGLGGSLRHLADMVLGDPDVDEELPLERSRLHLLLDSCASLDGHDETTRVELLAQLGVRATADDSAPREAVEDDWFVAGRRVEERDRLITSATWLFGCRSRRWARLLRFAPVPQTIAEPWPMGSTVKVTLAYAPGLFPLRAQPEGDGFATPAELPDPHENGLEALLQRFVAALAANPFLRVLPFLISLRPGGGVLADTDGRALPWRTADDLALRVECIAGGHAVPMCGEWDGRFLRLLAIRDGDAWIPLAPQQP